MTKRHIDLDDELLDAARRALGTSGVSDTVRGALQQAVAAAVRAEEVEWLIGGGLSELTNREQRDAVWR